MKVICIGFGLGLTPNNHYDVIDIIYNQFPDWSSKVKKIKKYKIIDDNGLINWFYDDVLTPLDEYREDKLNELGI
jgi:hypothetical protein